ncbi:MAG: hypothetical protein LBH68_02645 [Bifidobacteriaceae bacterium]|jgi:hypothetical protein|nr:hypothetical protein [Bifidobacteriaceae bacterium]
MSAGIPHPQVPPDPQPWEPIPPPGQLPNLANNSAFQWSPAQDQGLVSQWPSDWNAPRNITPYGGLPLQAPRGSSSYQRIPAKTYSESLPYYITKVILILIILAVMAVLVGLWVYDITHPGANNLSARNHWRAPLIMAGMIYLATHLRRR